MWLVSGSRAVLNHRLQMKRWLVVLIKVKTMISINPVFLNEYKEDSVIIKMNK